MNQSPLVTVLFPVYNGEKYLKEAVGSILSQTYSNFEFVIIYNNSTDNTLSILKSYNDRRIRIIHNEVPKNLANSLNQGIKLAKGKYIARMDCDDISLPDRLESQVAFMEQHEDCVVLGMWANIIGSRKSLLPSLKNMPTEYIDIKSSLIFRSPMIHPTVMLRRDVLLEHGLLYDSQYLHGAQDYGLWVNISRNFKLYNLPKVGLQYRRHDNNISHINNAVIHEKIRGTKLIALQQLNLHITDNSAISDKLINILNLEVPIDLDALDLLKKLLDEMRQKQLMSEKWLNYYYWRYCCYAANYGLASFIKFVKSNYFSYHPRLFILLALCVIRKSR